MQKTGQQDQREHWLKQILVGFPLGFHDMVYTGDQANIFTMLGKKSPPQSPKILSALYAYDGCMGGVNNFPTEEEYMDEIKRFVVTTVWKSYPICLQEKVYCGGGAWREGGSKIDSLIFFAFHRN